VVLVELAIKCVIFYAQVFSPLQAALFFIYSCPNIPDVLAMIQAMKLPSRLSGRKSGLEGEM
jgi:hypothetical protein